MNRLALLFRQLVIAIIFAVPSTAFAQPVLEGKVHHSERLPPLDSNFLPGHIFDESRLPPMGTNSGWYRIPNWFAGVWHRDTIIQKGLLGIKSEVQNSRNMRRGYQTDALGGIWDYRDEPFADPVDIGASVDYKVVRIREPVSISGKSVTLHFIASCFLINKTTHEIVKAYQEEEFQTWQGGDHQNLRCDASQRIFDAFGASKQVSTCSFVDRLLQEYAPIDKYHGKDLKADFVRFLTSHGMSERVPQ